MIGETLTRATPELDFGDQNVIAGLRSDITDVAIPSEYETFVGSTMASWLESCFGLRREVGTERLIRAKPLAISGENSAAEELSRLTAVEQKACVEAIERWLLAGYNCQPRRDKTEAVRVSSAPVHQPRRFRIRFVGRQCRPIFVDQRSAIRPRQRPQKDPAAARVLSRVWSRVLLCLESDRHGDGTCSFSASQFDGPLAAAGSDGISHDELTQRVNRALNLPLELFAREPGVQFAQKADTERAFRNVLGYRLYRDQKRGWRVTSPNLEQCGLLRIEYPSLGELCHSEEFWNGCHAALVGASPDTRNRICRALLDYLRRELAIDVDYLTSDFFERLQQQSSQRLREPWAIDEQERPELASAVFPRGRQPHDRMYFIYLSGRSGYGTYLGRRGTLPEFDRSAGNLKLVDKDEIIRDLFEVLGKAGYLVKAVEPSGDDNIAGYQLSASAMQWHVADGTVAFHDPIRVPNPPQEGGRTNTFSVEFYRSVAGQLQGMEAREHTAQVPYEERERRERDFGAATLPVLYCSPTMELAVDIRQLNVVNMRNVPPTPANYAQRSGHIPARRRIKGHDEFLSRPRFLAISEFGPRKPEVKVVTYYGTDNQIDGVVLEVLIRKHKAIRKALGVSIPVPTTSNAVLEALYEGLLLRRKDTKQQLLPFEDDEEVKPKTAEFNNEWQNAADREKKSRSLFAQHTIKPDEVAHEVAQIQAAIGSATDVENFVVGSSKAFGGVVGSRNGRFEFNLTESPRAVRESIGNTTKFAARFDPTVGDDELYLSRTHPITEGLATYVMDSALDEASAGNGPVPAARRPTV